MRRRAARSSAVSAVDVPASLASIDPILAYPAVHGGLGDVELACDLLVGESTGDRIQHFDLAIGQTSRPNLARPSFLPWPAGSPIRGQLNIGVAGRLGSTVRLSLQS